VLDSEGDPLTTPLALVLLMKNESDSIGGGPAAEVTPDARYLIKGIAPGTYRLIGLNPFQLGWGFDNDGLKRYYPRGEEIEVKEGDRLTRDVKLLPREDANAKPKQ
jgi:hypothetical protein